MMRDSFHLPTIAPAPLGTSAWLLHLRSFAVAGQLLTILASRLLTNLQLPYLRLLALVALTAITNLVYAVWLSKRAERSAETKPAFSSRVKRQEITGDTMNAGDTFDLQHRVAFLLMILDLLTLTTMLYLSGGSGNPFSFFYFVNLAVGGVMIRPKAAWSLTAIAIIAFAVLLVSAPDIPGLSAERLRTSVLSSADDLRAIGLMIAFGTCASVVTYFVTLTTGELKERERQLRSAEAERAASHRLEGLTTLAAGAAHELATPLSTIDVIVRELSRHLEDCEKPKSVETDLELIDGQLEMCKQILQRMRSAAGDSMAQRWHETTVGDLIDATLEGIRDPHRVDVADGTDDLESTPLWVPQEAVAQSVRNLIHNGLDASPDSGRVSLSSRLVKQSLELTVLDSGHGMSVDTLNRASDPFFTTKEPGKGIGLGLFLTRNVISQLGGTLQFASQPNMGTQAIVTIPLQPPQGNVSV